jgi:hypothetical protein
MLSWLAQHPLLLLAVASGVLVLGARVWRRRRSERARGWRVRTEGFEARYEEWIEDRWQGLSFVNRPVPGRTRRAIHLPSELEWAAQPDWLRARRELIQARIREHYPPGLYDYSGAPAATSGVQAVKPRKP